MALTMLQACLCSYRSGQVYCNHVSQHPVILEFPGQQVTGISTSSQAVNRWTGLQGEISRGIQAVLDTAENTNNRLEARPKQ
jgi:hypothetical protein